MRKDDEAELPGAWLVPRDVVRLCCRASSAVSCGPALLILTLADWSSGAEGTRRRTTRSGAVHALRILRNAACVMVWRRDAVWRRQLEPVPVPRSHRFDIKCSICTHGPAMLFWSGDSPMQGCKARTRAAMGGRGVPWNGASVAE